MKSIRVYLIVALLSTITLVNFLAATRGYQKSMEQVLQLLDTQLAETAALIQALPTGQAVVPHRQSDRFVFQVWAKNEALLSRSKNAGADPVAQFKPGYRDENFGGFRWRVLSQFDDNKQQWVFVAERLDTRVDLADSIIVQSVLPILLSLPLVACIIWLVVSHGLSQMKKLAMELGSKRADDLSVLAISNPPKEMNAVVSAINDLLSRLNQAVQRERQFSADAAHELRTPLSALKVHVHNLLDAHPDLKTDGQALTEDLNRLEHLIEQIVLLYRTTPEHYQSRMIRTSLRALAQQAIGELFNQIDGKQQSIELHGEDCEIIGDEASLKILLKNLLQNASKYSGDGAKINVDIERIPAGVKLEVVDNGPGIPLIELTRVFDRFYRVGGDRHSSSVQGCGLGLSIAKHIADLHQASLRLQNNESGYGLTASVVFPEQLETRVLVEEITR